MASIPGVGFTEGTSMLSIALQNMNKRNGAASLSDFMQNRTNMNSQLTELASSLAGRGSVANNLITGGNTSSGPGKVEVTSFGTSGYGQSNMTKLPKYNASTVQHDYLSKSDGSMTEKEFEAAIKKLAEKNAAAGIYEDVGDDYYELAQKYVSVVSPDRQAIIAGAPMGSLVPSGLNYDVAKAYDDKGNVVATYNPSKGWNNKFTDEEKARNNKFDEIYWSAYNAYVKANNLDEKGKETEETGPADAVVGEEEESDTPPSVDVTA